MDDYQKFLDDKAQKIHYSGFDPIYMPDFLYDFQRDLVTWSIKKGKAAIFADCGMGKTPMYLVWAQNVIQKTNKPVLVITPLAVSAQTIREADKFGIAAERSREGKHSNKAQVVVTNYERLEYFDPEEFSGVVCDESSAIKNFAGKRRKTITHFMRTRPYRLLCTATASPNDFVELGTSSEALGELQHMEMLQMFFRSEDNTLHPGRRHYNAASSGQGWVFKAHAEQKFWKWVASWARALRKPSDLGFDDGPFVLPKLLEREHLVEGGLRDGFLFPVPAMTFGEQREERRNTIEKRCGMVADLVNHDQPAVIWGHLNQETDYLEKIIPGAVQVKGSDLDEKKEEAFLGFASGDIRVLITKPKIGAFGLNWQHCNHMTFFPSHSFEQYYQGVRRCWRFGQKRPVTVDIVTSEGEIGVMRNLQRKADNADKMFSVLVEIMNEAAAIGRKTNVFDKKTDIPSWL